MKWKTAAYCCLLLVAITACHVSDPGEEVVQIGVDDELIVDMVQQIHNGSVELGLTIVSSTPYDCGGAGYDYRLFTAPDQISLYLNSVLLPQPCSAGPAPARERIIIPGQHGEYEMSIGIGDLIQNSGMLTIDDEGFRLNMEQQHGISINHNFMYRIPQYTIWGYAYSPHDQGEVFNEVINVLDPVTDPVSLPTGYYGLFNAVTTSSVQILQPGLKAGTETFVFRYTKPLSELQSKVAQLRQNLPAGTELQVLAWEGSVF